MFAIRFAGATAALILLAVSIDAQQTASDTAWRDGRLQVNVADVIGRSDIVLGRPNVDPSQAVPLGNGRLGAAVWAQDGLTVQLNRADTLPYRYSTGQVVLPGIASLTAAQNYAGKLNLYDGAFEEHGAGMTATVYVQPDSDTLVIDVTGADPSKPQTALLKLWKPRMPTASVTGSTGMLVESWLDDKQPGSSGRRFGSFAAITAKGRKVSATIADPLTVMVKVTPDADGHFRILIASPHYEGNGVPNALAAKAFADDSALSHERWWHSFWHHADIVKVSSVDGSGEYMENLRNIYLFSSAAENRDEFPGSQAGVGDLFSAVKDDHKWDPGAFWHWNLRMQIAANLGAGLPELNQPYFRLYRENLANMETWTKQHMRGAPGICIPETMRFNGAGIEFETWGGNTKDVTGWNCDAASGPYYNARTLSTGAEVSLWIWQQYLATEDREFLLNNFPVMAEAARFMLAYEKPGTDGLMHTSPSNAHETQWDVTDPTTDIAAREVLYTATIEAATLLHREPALVERLRSELPKIPPLPRVSAKDPKTLLAVGDDAGGDDMIATSYRPGDPMRNVENIGLEPVWPYDLIGDTSPLFKLAQRTYFARPNKAGIDWSFDPVQAARLNLGEEVRSTLVDITQANQRYINGFAKWGGDGTEFYVEQTAIVALGLQAALAQDYDGIIRVAPAVPAEWNFDGTVSVRNGTKVEVQARDGKPTTIGLEVHRAQRLKVKNPWPGKTVIVKDARSGAIVLKSTTAPVIAFAANAGRTYRIELANDMEQHPFVAVDGIPATSAKRLGPVQIGLEPVAAQP